MVEPGPRYYNYKFKNFHWPCHSYKDDKEYKIVLCVHSLHNIFLLGWILQVTHCVTPKYEQSWTTKLVMA